MFFCQINNFGPCIHTSAPNQLMIKFDRLIIYNMSDYFKK